MVREIVEASAVVSEDKLVKSQAQAGDQQRKTGNGSDGSGLQRDDQLLASVLSEMASQARLNSAGLGWH